MLKAENVRKSYGKNEVLKGINLEIAAGEVTCLLGPSGSGKSTFLRCINRLEKIDSGRIYIENELVGVRQHNGKLYEQTDKEVCKLREKAGMVFQHFNLFPHLTVLQNLIEGPVIVRKESRKVATERALGLLEKVGMLKFKDAYPKQLSGGQQQRVAIARSLNMEPSLMLFDEPTSALDPELVGEVLTTMKDLAASGMTMIVVTHEIQFAQNVATNVVFMDGGYVIEQGRPNDILVNPQHPRTQEFLSNVS
ncbi:amino acid ABC transporter ATP-binding protein [Paraglaciecola sp. 2405UD69-4]|uniref:amino acid ABC transporter ATP-binding protein n=1 Tax=Paraglaciecola sp. 2405UD69-4 TaxID=3391836 RepID=UPI0039C9AE8A